MGVDDLFIPLLPRLLRSDALQQRLLPQHLLHTASQLRPQLRQRIGADLHWQLHDAEGNLESLGGTVILLLTSGCAAGS